MMAVGALLELGIISYQARVRGSDVASGTVH
jgi:hypothetical protein